MVEERINDLIAKMELFGFEWFADNDKGVYFKPLGGSGELRMDDWDSVEAFIDRRNRESD